jgi:hypothetical protein
MNYPKIVQSNNPSKPSVTNDFTNNVKSNSIDKDNKMNSIKLEIMNSSEGYGTYFKKGATYKEVFGNFGSEPNTTTPK